LQHLQHNIDRIATHETDPNICIEVLASLSPKSLALLDEFVMLRTTFDAQQTHEMMGDRHKKVMRVIVQCRKKYAETESAMKPRRVKPSWRKKPAPVDSVQEYLANIGYKQGPEGPLITDTDTIPMESWRNCVCASGRPSGPLGHASLATTGIYLTVSPKHRRESYLRSSLSDRLTGEKP
jgi:hypothetical protein